MTKTNIDWTLDPNTVHCWVFRPNELPAEKLVSLLSADERHRATSFAFDRDRNQFIVCRAVLRYLLERYGAGPAAQLRFEYSAKGKPRLSKHSLEFNIAHTRTIAAVAITRGHPVGIDVETIRPLVDLPAIVETSFASEEQAVWRSLPRAQQLPAFFLGWTRKEAFIKATGEGLSRTLHSFAISLDSPPRFIRLDTGDPVDWTLANIDLGDEVACAVAVAGSRVRIEVKDFSAVMLQPGGTP